MASGFTGAPVYKMKQSSDLPVDSNTRLLCHNYKNIATLLPIFWKYEIMNMVRMPLLQHAEFCFTKGRYHPMETRRICIDSQNIDIEMIRQAADIIRGGGLVAFPTETVYGLGADAMNPEASGKIYKAKGRPSDNPLIVHISRYEELLSIAEEIPPQARTLAAAFWPGPLTMIVRKKENVPRETTGGLDTVAVRMPDHPVALALIACSGSPVAAPSANTSGRPSPTQAEHVAADMDGRIPMILDAGPVGIGIESTIIDLTEGTPTILRPGYITKEMLENVLCGEVRMDPGITAAEYRESAGEAVRPKAPGMRYRHYAPRAELTLVEGKTDRVAEEINRLAHREQTAGKKVGVIASDETRAAYRADYVVSIGRKEDEEAIARRLYGILREFDGLDVDVIYSECFDTPQMGQAIMNRLRKAAGYRVLHTE